ncbi:DNA repair protein RecO [Candidatus Falkowbacteria bacterium]|nr:DNA repair protein RecO [Candidatus Falkowbacteria bacterium]
MRCRLCLSCRHSWIKMEETFDTKAIILDRRPFKEYDNKIIVFSREKGKLELVARGSKRIRSKTSGHIEPAILSKLMVVFGKQYDYLGSAVGVCFYSNIKNDLKKTMTARKALGLINKLTREGEVDGQAEVFDLLKKFLDILDKGKADIEMLFFSFVLRLSVLIGFCPNLNEWRINADSLDIIKSLLRNDLPNLSYLEVGGKDRKNISRSIVKFMQYNFDIDSSWFSC